MVTGFDWRFLQDMDYKFRRLNSWRGTVDADYDVNNGARAAQPAHDEHAQADVDEELQQEINSMSSTWRLRTWRLKMILKQLLRFKMYLRFRLI